MIFIWKNAGKDRKMHKTWISFTKREAILVTFSKPPKMKFHKLNIFDTKRWKYTYFFSTAASAIVIIRFTNSGNEFKNKHVLRSPYHKFTAQTPTAKWRRNKEENIMRDASWGRASAMKFVHKFHTQEKTLLGITFVWQRCYIFSEPSSFNLEFPQRVRVERMSSTLLCRPVWKYNR